MLAHPGYESFLWLLFCLQEAHAALQIELTPQYRDAVAEAGKAAALAMAEVDNQPAADESHWPCVDEDTV